MSERAVKTVNSSNVMSSDHFHYAVLICHTYNLAMADCITDGIMSFSIRSDLPQLLARESGLYTAYKTSVIRCIGSTACCLASFDHA